jgi:hypothetical protein
MTPRLLAAALLAAVMLPGLAHAQLFRAYLTSTGSDANPCTLPQPCRLLPAALAAVADGGEIWMLDSANYNVSQVNVTKSVTILAVPGALGSVVATGGGDAININAAGAKVTLRNLVIVHLTSSANGVYFLQGAELNVIRCEISGMQGRGIFAGAPGGKVTVRDTVLRGNALYGFSAGAGVTAALERVHAVGNGASGVLATEAHVVVSDSLIEGNYYGVQLFASGGMHARAAVEGSTITGNTYGISVSSALATDFVEIAVSRNVISHSATAAIYAGQGASSSVTIVAGGNTIIENPIGFAGSAGSTVYSRGTNTLKFNATDVVTVSLTPLAGQ